MCHSFLQQCGCNIISFLGLKCQMQNHKSFDPIIQSSCMCFEWAKECNDLHSSEHPTIKKYELDYDYCCFLYTEMPPGAMHQSSIIVDSVSNHNLNEN